jgi:hypothetical protein
MGVSREAIRRAQLRLRRVPSIVKKRFGGNWMNMKRRSGGRLMLLLAVVGVLGVVIAPAVTAAAKPAWAGQPGVGKGEAVLRNVYYYDEDDTQ